MLEKGLELTICPASAAPLLSLLPYLLYIFAEVLTPIDLSPRHQLKRVIAMWAACPFIGCGKRTIVRISCFEDILGSDLETKLL